MSLMPLLAMYSADEKQRKCEYSKVTTGSVQNGDFYSKNQYSALLFHTNPLPLTILNNISVNTVALGGLLSLLLQHCNRESPWSFFDMILQFRDVTHAKIKRNSNSTIRLFLIRMGKQSFLFLQTLHGYFLHFKAALLLEYIKEDDREKEALKKSLI
jgi:hypothetical protein